VKARTLLMSFSSDWLYPARDSEDSARARRANGTNVRHEVIDAAYGHDSFLREEDRMTELVQEFLTGGERGVAPAT